LEELRVFSRSESGVIALAIYTTGRVGDLPILQGFNRGSRPLFGSGRTAQ